MSTIRIIKLIVSGVLTTAAFFLSGGDAQGAAPSSSVSATVRKGRLVVSGTGAADQVAIRLRPGDPNTVDVDVQMDGVADFSFARSRFTAIDLTLGGGNDTGRIDDTGGMFTDTETTTLDGGSGDDRLFGGVGPETLVGGSGADSVDAGRDADVVSLGTGDDEFEWDPGDGSDVVDGGDGTDRVRFSGGNIGEVLDLSADAGRLRLTRDIATVTLLADAVERAELRAFGGMDRINVHDLTGTDVATVAVDLAANVGGGDAAADSIVVEGTEAADAAVVDADGAAARVRGLAGTEVLVTNGEATLDVLGVNTLGGGDEVTADPAAGASVRVLIDGGSGVDEVTTNGTAGADSYTATANGSAVAIVDGAGRFVDAYAESTVINGLGGADFLGAVGNVAALTSLTLDGGDDADVVLGGNGADLLIGGAGADLVDGNQGTDTLQLGAGDDVFQWDPGDGSDAVDGGEGVDRVRFNGSNIGEVLDLSADAGRLRLTRDIGIVTLLADAVERAELRTLGGTDRVNVHDLTGTDVAAVAVDLAAFAGGGDTVADSIVVEGTEAADAATVDTDGAATRVRGLAGTEVLVSNGETTLDVLGVNTLGGADAVAADPAAGAAVRVLIDGGAGLDVVTTNGTAGPDSYTATANGSAVAIVDGAGRFVDAFVESTVINGLGGADFLGAVGNVAALTSLTLDGGDDADVVLGGNGADLLIGGAGADLLDGNQGTDTLDMGAGDDVFQWDPGDGSDVADGGNGTDRLRFNASNAGEVLDLSADAGRLRLTRDIGIVTLLADAVERAELRTFGSADRVNVHDLTGTDVATVAVDLAASIGGGDAATDSIVVEGTEGADAATVDADGAATRLRGLAGTEVQVTNGEPTLDVLGVNTLGGADAVTADPAAGAAVRPVIDGGSGLDVVTTNGTAGPDSYSAIANGPLVAIADAAGRYYDTAVESVVVNGLGGADTLGAVGNLAALTSLTLDGGDDADVVLGGNGADLLIGGAGADLVDGNQGTDTLQLGAGDDVFQWDPGDSSDVVDGGDGTDRLRFNASNAGEILDLSADAGRLRLTRDIGAVTLLADAVERAELRTFGSADRVTVHDLTGTDVTAVAVDVAASVGGGDAATDSIIVEGTEGDDTLAVTATGAGVTVSGLTAEVSVLNPESIDRLDVLTLGGADSVDAQLPAGLIQLYVDGAPQ